MSKKTERIFTIRLEFVLGNHKTHTTRLEPAYEAAVRAATEAVEKQLIEESITAVHTHMCYDYRRLDVGDLPADATVKR
jgi:hypothetical protein